MRIMLLLAFLLPLTLVNSQIVFYSPKNPTQYDYAGHNIIGKVKNNIIVLKYVVPGKKFEFLVYNYNMQLLRTVPLDLFPENGLYSIDFVNRSDHFDAVIQYYTPKQFYCKIASIDHEGNLMQPLKTIDSTETAEANGNDAYAVIHSKNNQYLCLMRLWTGIRPGCLQLDYSLLDTNLDIVKGKRNLVPFNSAIAMSPFYLDNNGDLLFAEFARAIDSGRNACSFTVYKIERDNDTALNSIHEINDCYLKNARIEINDRNDRYMVSGLVNGVNRDSSKKILAQGIFTSILNADLTPASDDSVFMLHESPALGEMACSEIFDMNDIIAGSDSNYIIVCTAKDIPHIGVNYIVRPPSSILTTNERPFYIQPDLSSAVKMTYNTLNNPVSPVYYNPATGTFAGSPGTVSSKVSIEQNEARNKLILLNVNGNNQRKWLLQLGGKIERDYASRVNICKGINTGHQLCFVYPRMVDKKRKAIGEIIVSPDGSYQVKPLIANDFHYDLQVELGVQVDDRSIVFPCRANGRLAFARIEF